MSQFLRMYFWIYINFIDDTISSAENNWGCIWLFLPYRYVYFRWRNMGDLVFIFYDVVSISYVTSRTTKSYTWPIWISGQGSDAAVTDCTQHSWTDFQVKIVEESKPPTATDSSVELKLTTVRDWLCPFIFIIAIKCKIVAVISNTNRLAPGQYIWGLWMLNYLGTRHLRCLRLGPKLKYGSVNVAR